MAHGTLIRNPVTNWTNASTVLSTELQTFEQALAAAVNADDGGCWANSGGMSFGGSGLQLSGPLLITRGGRITTMTNPTITCADNDWPVLDPSNPHATHTIVHPCCLGVSPTPWLFRARAQDGGLQAVAPTYQVGSGANIAPAPAMAYVKLRAHDASTITSVTVNFKVSVVHTALPTTMPAVRVIRVGALGDIVPLTSQAAGGDPNGYIFVNNPTGPAAWFNFGQAQSITIPCDQNNVVNTSLWDYRVELVDEQGMSTTTYPFLLLLTAPISTWAQSTNYPVDTVIVPSAPHANGAIFTQTLPQIPPPVWQPGVRYRLGEIVAPSHPTGLYYVCIGTWSFQLTSNSVGSVAQSTSAPTNPTEPDWRANGSFSGDRAAGSVIPGELIPPGNESTGIGGIWVELTYQNNTTTTPGNVLVWQAIGNLGPNGVPIPISGGTEPSWIAGITQNTVDLLLINQAALSASGGNWNQMNLGSLPPFYAVNCAPQWTSYGPPTGTIWLNAVATYANIPDLRFQ